MGGVVVVLVGPHHALLIPDPADAGGQGGLLLLGRAPRIQVDLRILALYSGQPGGALNLLDVLLAGGLGLVLPAVLLRLVRGRRLLLNLVLLRRHGLQGLYGAGLGRLLQQGLQLLLGQAGLGGLLLGLLALSVFRFHRFFASFIAFDPRLSVGGIVHDADLQQIQLCQMPDLLLVNVILQGDVADGHLVQHTVTDELPVVPACGGVANLALYIQADAVLP